jgi:hypothetical protein
VKIISHFEVKMGNCVYHGTIRLRTTNPKCYTADWHCAQNGKIGQLGYDLPDCHLIERAAEKEIRNNHRDVKLAA